ncbi:MAG: response regulator [Desulfobacteraceae bacterium]|nr:response regulator [Desulfobacteraceae bacterium]
MPSEPSKSTILVVDDVAENIDILLEILARDYRVMAANNGKKALGIANSATPPDLILLDIVMPGMDGYEVCQRLKAAEKTRKIPVIFITSNGGDTNEARGFALGAVDYIRKPINPAVLKARVHAHAELKRHRDNLENLAQERARQLMHSERLASLGTLAAGIAHEINNPLTYVMGNAEILKFLFDSMAREGVILDSENFAANIRESAQRVTEIIKGANMINAIVDGMQRFSRQDTHAREPIDIGGCINNAITLCHFHLKHLKRVRLTIEPDLPRVIANGRQIEQVLINLLKNACDAIGEDAKGSIEIRVQAAYGSVTITVEDNGPGIPGPMLNVIWKAFYTTKPNGLGTGLGLSISKNIIEEHKGRIWAENRRQKGARFIIELPSS